MIGLACCEETDTATGDWNQQSAVGHYRLVHVLILTNSARGRYHLQRLRGGLCHLDAAIHTDGGGDGFVFCCCEIRWSKRTTA